MTIHPPRDARGKLKRPYAKGGVSVDRSKEQISKLLREFGAEGVEWSDNFSTGSVQLRFAVRETDGRLLGFKVTPAAFREKHRVWDEKLGRTVEKEVPDWARAMRLLLAWLKTKLEAIAFGLTAVEEEFLAQRVVYDHLGRETTIGDAVIPQISASGRLALAPPKDPADP